MKHSVYKKQAKDLEFIDVYRVLDLFEVTQPALQHAAKKVLCAGKRGGKAWRQDVQEAIDSLQRALEMDEETPVPAVKVATSADLQAKVARINGLELNGSVFPIPGASGD